MKVFEVDQPGAQAWKQRRLRELGFGIPEWLRLVPIDFEAGGSWQENPKNAGFDSAKPAVLASTGVSMYLTKDAIAATLRQIAEFAPGSTLAMTFILPLELRNPRSVRDARRRREAPVQAAHRFSVSFLRRKCSHEPARQVSRKSSTSREPG